MNELMNEFGINDNTEIDANDDDDLKSIPSEDDDDDEDEESGDDEDDGIDADGNDDTDDGAEDLSNASAMLLKQEMNERANDLEILRDAMLNCEDPKEEIAKMEEAMDDRQQKMLNSLEDLSCGDDAIQDIKESNDEWKQYVLNLSASILKGNDENNQTIDEFLKELIGRTNDVKSINSVYYEEAEQQTDFAKLKQSVDKRHDEISSAINQKEESTDDADDKE